MQPNKATRENKYKNDFRKKHRRDTVFKTIRFNECQT